MSYRPRIMRENEAYGRVSNVPSEPENENAYSDNELAPERSEEEIS